MFNTSKVVQINKRRTFVVPKQVYLLVSSNSTDRVDQIWSIHTYLLPLPSRLKLKCPKLCSSLPKTTVTAGPAQSRRASRGSGRLRTNPSNRGGADTNLFSASAACLRPSERLPRARCKTALIRGPPENPGTHRRCHYCSFRRDPWQSTPGVLGDAAPRTVWGNRGWRGPPRESWSSFQSIDEMARKQQRLGIEAAAEWKWPRGSVYNLEWFCWKLVMKKAKFTMVCVHFCLYFLEVCMITMVFLY